MSSYTKNIPEQYKWTWNVLCDKTRKSPADIWEKCAQRRVKERRNEPVHRTKMKSNKAWSCCKVYVTQNKMYFVMEWNVTFINRIGKGVLSYPLWSELYRFLVWSTWAQVGIMVSSPQPFFHSNCLSVCLLFSTSDNMSIDIDID